MFCVIQPCGAASPAVSWFISSRRLRGEGAKILLKVIQFLMAPDRHATAKADNEAAWIRERPEGDLAGDVAPPLQSHHQKLMDFSTIWLATHHCSAMMSYVSQHQTQCSPLIHSRTALTGTKTVDSLPAGNPYYGTPWPLAIRRSNTYHGDSSIRH